MFIMIIDRYYAAPSLVERDIYIYVQYHTYSQHTWNSVDSYSS